MLIVGELQKNRTRRYLVPSIKCYGKEFETKLSSLSTLAVKIIPEEQAICFIIDIKGSRKYNRYVDENLSKINFFHTLNYFRTLNYYIRDFPYDSGKTGHQHCIAFKCIIDLSKFIKGEYSKLYTEEQLSKYFNKQSATYAVLTQDNKYRPEYLRYLNETFKTTLKLEDVKHHQELDMPPFLNDELLHANI